MREIKFRAFVDGEMISAECLTFEEYAPLVDQLANCENLMQYTGLKDRNGVDIYEGDIVLMDDDTGEGYRSRVYYTDGALCVDVRHCDYDFTAIGWVLSNPSIGVYSMEVIGNIHQTPELIED